MEELKSFLAALARDCVVAGKKGIPGEYRVTWGGKTYVVLMRERKLSENKRELELIEMKLDGRV